MNLVIISGQLLRKTVQKYPNTKTYSFLIARTKSHRQTIYRCITTDAAVYNQLVDLKYNEHIIVAGRLYCAVKSKATLIQVKQVYIINIKKTLGISEILPLNENIIFEVDDSDDYSGMFFDEIGE